MNPRLHVESGLAPDALRRGFAAVTGLVAGLMVWRAVGTGI